jgi:hypothetical protein
LAYTHKKFLVDNAESMGPHWYRAKYLLETLLLKAAGQDEDGMDLSFTSGNVRVEGKTGESKFLAAMDKTDAKPRKGMPTNMTTRLGEILFKYILEAEKAKSKTQTCKNLTLIVLTDGLWDGMENKNQVYDMIVTFAKKLEGITGYLNVRPLSIEFIQFGDDFGATSRLRRLDDGLQNSGIP